MRNDAPASIAQHPFAVGIVHVQHRTMLLGHLGNAVQRRYVPVHGEDAIGDDQYPLMFGRMPFRIIQHLGEVSHVGVLVDRTIGMREASPRR